MLERPTTNKQEWENWGVEMKEEEKSVDSMEASREIVIKGNIVRDIS